MGFNDIPTRRAITVAPIISPGIRLLKNIATAATQALNSIPGARLFNFSNIKHLQS
jgi:hypothetical protein